MKNYDVYGIGNALVDTEYEVDDAFLEAAQLQKGIMTLIEEEERARIIHLLETEHEHQVIKLAGGGSAANTTVIVAQLGGNAFYSCKVANDSTGDFFVKDLKLAGVDTNLADDRESGVTGECISMVTPDAERTMTTHLGITQFLSAAEVAPDQLRQSKYLYIEGYLVSSPSGFEAALQAQAIAKAAGIPVTLTLSDPAMVENFKQAFDQLVSEGIDMIFCNQEEACLFTGTDNLVTAAKLVGEACPRYAITSGADGAIVFDGSSAFSVPAVPTTPVDTTGAGDIFAGSFLWAMSQGQGFETAAELANKAASILVSSFGARLPQDVVTHNLT